jgi:hypothetical protein
VNSENSAARRPLNYRRPALAAAPADIISGGRKSHFFSRRSFLAVGNAARARGHHCRPSKMPFPSWSSISGHQKSRPRQRAAFLAAKNPVRARGDHFRPPKMTFPRADGISGHQKSSLFPIFP